MRSFEEKVCTEFASEQVNQFFDGTALNGIHLKYMLKDLRLKIFSSSPYDMLHSRSLNSVQLKLDWN